ncbi:MAG: sigma-70 family RNA polymerase sigma factor [Acidimicrobiales bacterium]
MQRPRRPRPGPASSDHHDPLSSLASAAAAGHSQALEELVRLTQPDVWRLCVALGSRGHEEDLVQETYLRAIRSLGSYRSEAPFRSWLLSVARHVCADDVRKRERQRRLLTRVTPTVSDDTPEHGYTETLLSHLDPDRRDAFVLTQVAGVSYVDAAVILGCAVGTIRSRVARARIDLRELVAISETA